MRFFSFCAFFVLMATAVAAQNLPDGKMVVKDTKMDENNIVIEQVTPVNGSYRRIYDFHNEMACFFYNHSVRANSGGGLSCHFFADMPPRAKLKYVKVCQQFAPDKTVCPEMSKEELMKVPGLMPNK